MLWPIKGIPSDPGGSLFDDLLPHERRRKMGVRKRKIARIIFIVLGCLWCDHSNKDDIAVITHLTIGKRCLSQGEELHAWLIR